MDLEKITLSLFTPDPWEHVCPVLRYIGPIEQANWRLLHGNNWQDSKPQVDLEVIKESDIVVIQRDFPRFGDICDTVIEKARSCNKPIIYEIDDLLTEIPNNHPDYESYKNAQAPILGLIAQADGVTCPTIILQNYLLQFNENVGILPNYLNDNIWQLLPPFKENNPSSPLVIGYMGSRSHINDLVMITSVLSEILDKFGDSVLFRSWGTPLPETLLGKANVEFIDLGLVSYKDFAAHFSQQRCDIFIAPLVDNQFNRCKSALKFLEYSVLGVAGVFSNMPPYSTVVRNGENGILATNEIDWYDSLTELIRSQELRYRIGKAAYDTVCNSYLLSKEIPNWKESLKRLIREINLKRPQHTTISLARKFVAWSQQERLEMLELRSILEERNQIINSLSYELDEKQKIINSLSYELERTSRDLRAITQSTGWHFLEFLYRIRLGVAPRNSKREKILAKIKQKLGFLYRLTKASLEDKKLDGAEKTPSNLLGRENVTFKLETSTPVQTPSVAVLIEKAAFFAAMEESLVLDWINTQTLKPSQIVVWDSESQTARIRERDDEKTHQAKNLKELCNLIRADYLCIASNDLIKQHATYLEENLVALASHNLLFCLNVNGLSDWPIRHVKEGRLPGSRIDPFLRAVVRKDYVRNNYSLDLLRWKNEQISLPAIAGKLIHHTTNQIDPEINIPMETILAGGSQEVKLEILHNKYILVDSKDKDIKTPIESPLYLPELFMLKERNVDNRPTVFLLQPFLAVGGAENLALGIIKQLDPLIRFVVISVEQLDISLGTTSSLFRELTPFVYNFADFLEPPHYLSYLFNLIERFQPVSYYIHNGSPWLYDTISEVKKRYPEIRVVNQVYDSEVGWINRYNREIIQLTDAHIGANQRICNAYISRGVPHNQVYLIPHGLDVANFNPESYTNETILNLKQRFQIEPDKRVVTFASRLHPQKRPLDFIELARRFAGDPSIKFLMVGDGPLAEEIDRQIGRINLRNIIRYSFYRPISDLLAITDVLVLPSEFEGMPLIVAEAQAMGKPVVVTDVGNNKEVLQITSGGIVTEIGDISGLVKGVREMLDHPPDPSKVRNSIIQNFSIEVIAPKYIEALLGTNFELRRVQ